MKAFIRYRSPAEAGIINIAIRSWSAHGFDVKLLLPGMPDPSTGLVVNPCQINFGFRKAKKLFKRSTRKYGTRGWMTAPVVEFPPGTSDTVVLNCGRSL